MNQTSSPNSAAPGTANPSIRDAFDSKFKRNLLGLTLLWTLAITSLVAWDFWQAYMAKREDARSAAREAFRKDVIYRRWAALHGGIYVPVTPQTPPNPYLAHVPERDISTPSGMGLTLLNPAYMARQAHELGNKEDGSKGHLTSLKPIRPENAPDGWEKSVLQGFERGEMENSSIEQMNGQAYFRYMGALKTETACLKCHAVQGYKVGDVRGGISASVPWGPYRESLRMQMLSHLAGYCGIWIVGLLGMRSAGKRLRDFFYERLRAEQALRDSDERLRSTVDQLERNNAELQQVNAQLAQSQGQLLQSEKMAAIGQLAAGVAHEINNPVGFVNSNLGTLQGYVTRLLALADAHERCAGTGAAEDRAALQAAREAADLDFLRDDAVALLAESRDGMERVKKIVQDLRDFSRLDNAEWQDSDLLAGLESTLNVISNELKYKAELVKEYATLPPVRCNLAQINQVFMNLLVNAAQAIDGRGRIVLRSGAEGAWVWVSIEDTGKGMAPEVLKRIFEPFFTTKPVGKGTGLGLSLSYDIVKKHGGRIDVTSEPGVGSRFQIWLPVAGPAEATP